jgi:hypothetical protein
MTRRKVTTKPEPDGSFAYWLMLPFVVLMPAALPAEIAAQHPPGRSMTLAVDARKFKPTTHGTAGLAGRGC